MIFKTHSKIALASRGELFLSVLLFFLLLILSGCANNADDLTVTDLKQGIYGLEVLWSYQDSSGKVITALPEKFYPFTSYDVRLRLDNQAAYDATEISLSVFGLDGQYFEVIPTKQEWELLRGKSQFLREGEKKDFIFRTTAKKAPFQNTEEYRGNFFLTLVYKSEVDFTDTICLNPNFYDVYNSGCEGTNQLANGQKKSYSGQGAPIVVTEAEEIIHSTESGSSEAEFRLYFNNQGKGMIRKISLVSASLGGKSILCAFKGTNEKMLEMEKQNQEGVVICTSPLVTTQSYPTPLFVRLAYDYEVVQAQQLLLVK